MGRSAQTVCLLALAAALMASLSPVAAASTPNHSVWRLTLQDSALKTQIDMDIIIESGLSRTEIEDALLGVLAAQRHRQVFTHHDGYATHINIYAFASREDAESETRSWLARLAWQAEEDATTEITFSDQVDRIEVSAVLRTSPPLPEGAIARLGWPRPQKYQFSPDGRWLAVFNDKYTEIRDPNTLCIIGYLPAFPSWSSFAPDNRSIYWCGDDNKLRVWCLETQEEEIRALNGPPLNPWGTALCPHGRFLATASSNDGSVQLWDFDTGLLLRSLDGHAGNVRSLSFSPDGRTLASGSTDSVVKLWDIATGEELRRVSAERGSIQAMGWSPDGNMLAFVADSYWETSRSGEWALLVIWSVTEGVVHSFEPHREPSAWCVNQIQFTSDGAFLAYGPRYVNEGAVLVFDTSTWREVCAISQFGYGGFALNPDGTSIVFYADRALRQIAVGTWEEVSAVEPPLGWRSMYYTFNQAGTMLAAGDDHSIYLWKLEPWAIVRTLPVRTGSIKGLAFSPDGQVLAAWADDRTLRLWDVQSGQLLYPALAHTRSPLSTVAFSPDGTLLAAGQENWHLMSIWHVPSGQRVRTLSLPERVHVGFISFSPDGRYLAVGGWGNSIMVWDAGSFRLVRTLEFRGRANWAAWRPDGAAIMAGVAGTGLVAVEVMTGRSLFTLRDARGGVSFSPDGAVISVGSHVFSPTGDYLLGRSLGSGSVLYDAVSGQELLLTESPPADVAQGLALWDATSGGFLRFLEASPPGLGLVSSAGVVVALTGFYHLNPDDYPYAEEGFFAERALVWRLLLQ